MANKPGGTSVVLFAAGTGSKTNEIQHSIGAWQKPAERSYVSNKIKIDASM